MSAYPNHLSFLMAGARERANLLHGLKL